MNLKKSNACLFQAQAVAQPLTAAQLEDQRLVEATWAAVVEVFEAGVVAKFGLA